MAINLRCECGVDSKLTAKSCSSCGGVFPKKGRKYRVIVRAEGKRVTRIVPNLELAKEIEGKLKVDVIRGEHNIRKKRIYALGEIWGKYLPWAKENKKSWKSDFYIYKKHLEPELKDSKLDRISQFDVEKVMLRMKRGTNQHGKPYAAATIKHTLVLLSRLYSVADQWGLYDGKNPCKRVLPPHLNNTVVEFLADLELIRLVDVLEIWPSRNDAAFIKLLLFTGMRRGELFNLMWDDVDFVKRSMTLRDPKGKTDQILPLSGKAISVLELLDRTESPFIFPGKFGGKRTDFKRPWAKIKEASGLPVNFRLHGLRHHFASTLVSAGVDLFTVSKLLTHKNAKTTQRYAHLADQTLRDAVRLSDKSTDRAVEGTVVKMSRSR